MSFRELEQNRKRANEIRAQQYAMMIRDRKAETWSATHLPYSGLPAGKRHAGSDRD